MSVKGKRVNYDRIMAQRAAKKALQHSSFWLRDEDDVLDEEQNPLQRSIRLATIRRAIANFVQILSGKEVPVTFSSGKQSYTNGKQVVIAAEDDPKHFDHMVGLALHEAAHVLLTDFDYLQQVLEISDQLAGTPTLWHSAETVKQSELKVEKLRQFIPHELFVRLGQTPAERAWPTTSVPAALPTQEEIYAYTSSPFWGAVQPLFSHLKTLMNLLEDRRIDKWVYQQAHGYRPYYDALYKKYFFTKEISRNLLHNPEWKTVTIENYINRLLLTFHPDADPDALPGLRQMIATMDLPNIDKLTHDASSRTLGQGPPGTRALQTPLFQRACDLLVQILAQVDLAAETPPPAGPSTQVPPTGPSTPSDDGEGGGDEAESDLENMDMPTSGDQSSPGPYNPSKGASDIKQIHDLLNGTLRKKRASASEMQTIDAVESAQARMADVSVNDDTGKVSKVQCLVLRKLSPAVIKQSWFPFHANSYYAPALEKHIAAGKRMGAILAHRLQVRNDPLLTKYSRLQKGLMDKRLLHQLGMDITSVFQQTNVDVHKPALLHLSLDASGSMCGPKWHRVVTVATALAYVSTKLRSIDAIITIRGGSEMPVVAVVFDSRSNSFLQCTKTLRLIGPGGATPEGLCFKATMDLILEHTKTHAVYFINFSDGEPSFDAKISGDPLKKVSRRTRRAGRWDEYMMYSGVVATRHTRETVQEMRNNGIRVLSYFISDYSNMEALREKSTAWSAFRTMYGEDAVLTNVEQATNVIRTLNKYLVIRD